MTDKTPPSSYFAIDPGRTMGFAYGHTGASKVRSGTWRFRQDNHGEVFAEFASMLRRQLSSLPDPQLGMEMATIVPHNGNIDAKQVVFTAGWYAVAQTVCFTMGLRPPEFLPIQTWRSKTHGKVQIPKDLKETLKTQPARSRWFKDQAKAYADKNMWGYDTADEAEALCMLDSLRIMYEPGYAFDKGRSFKQEPML